MDLIHQFLGGFSIFSALIYTFYIYSKSGNVLIFVKLAI